MKKIISKEIEVQLYSNFLCIIFIKKYKHIHFSLDGDEMQITKCHFCEYQNDVWKVMKHELYVHRKEVLIDIKKKNSN